MEQLLTTNKLKNKYYEANRKNKEKLVENTIEDMRKRFINTNNKYIDKDKNSQLDLKDIKRIENR